MITIPRQKLWVEVVMTFHKKLRAILVALILLGSAESQAGSNHLQPRRFVPLVDHHQHLLSPAGAES
jgi:hypothetical protein